MKTKSPRTREEKAAAGVLLLTRDRAAARMRERARAADAALRERRNRDAAAALSALLLLGRKLSADLADALAVGRAEARNGALRRLKAELAAAGVTGALLSAVPAKREALDVARSRVVGESLAAQWRALALLDPGGGEGPAVTLPGKAFDARVMRAAATETARAYNEEHREALRDVARRDPELGERLMREWSAMLDACPRCWPHDGERVPIGESFSGGAEPGAMHPHCMCTERLVLE